MKAREVRKKLLKAGFEEFKQAGKGSHRKYKHPDGRWTTLSYHGGGHEIDKVTLRKIEEQAGIELGD